MSKKDVLKTIKDEDVEYVDIRFTDPRGKLQHVTVLADQVDEDFLDEGFMFDGSSIAGWKSIDQSDMKLMPDTASAYMDPFFAEATLAVHCSVVEPDTGVRGQIACALECGPAVAPAVALDHRTRYRRRDLGDR